MDRQELAKAITDETGVAHARAQAVLEVVFRKIKEGLDSDEEGVVLRGLGRFRHRKSADGERSTVIYTPADPERAKEPVRPASKNKLSTDDLE